MKPYNRNGLYENRFTEIVQKKNLCDVFQQLLAVTIFTKLDFESVDKHTNAEARV